MVSESDEQALRFGAFELDPGTAELRRDGTRLRLPPQPLKILTLLANRSGQLVTREEIREQIWGSDTFVDFEQGLNFAINRIRTVLGDDADNPRYIETLPRRGYRFVAQVERVDAASKDPSLTSPAMGGVPSDHGGVSRQQEVAPAAIVLPPEPSDFTQRAISVVVDAVVEAREEVDRWRRLATAGIVALVLAVVGGTLVGLNLGGVRDRLLAHLGWGRMDSVAVLPFENATGNPEAEYLSDGITENLINSLSQIPHLRVVPRSLAFRYKGKSIDPRSVGAQLNVRAIVTGQVTQRGDSLSIVTEITDARTVSQIWGQQYNRRPSDISTFEGEIARDISQELRLKLTPEEESRLARQQKVNPEAYELLLKARSQSGRSTAEGGQKAIEYAQQALALEPNYAEAYAILSAAYGYLGYQGDLPASEAFPKAKAAALRALQIDDSLPGAHGALGNEKWQYEWDWEGAERECRRAVELGPGDPGSHLNHAYSLVVEGRIKEGLAEAQRAESLDPLDPLDSHAVALFSYWLRRYDKALEEWKTARDVAPDFVWARQFPPLALARKGMREEAIRQYKEYLDWAGLYPGSDPIMAYLYAVAGKKEEARKILGGISGDAANPVFTAMAYGGLGDKDQAFAWLEKAYQQHHPYLVWIKPGIDFDSLRSDPRFKDLERRMGLPAQQ
jgi:TolB-like protein/DNA-binding winged helix-turn-helix (wHTH) protein